MKRMTHGITWRVCPNGCNAQEYHRHLGVVQDLDGPLRGQFRVNCSDCGWEGPPADTFDLAVVAAQLELDTADLARAL
jgi:hypothetical protein